MPKVKKSTKKDPPNYLRMLGSMVPGFGPAVSMGGNLLDAAKGRIAGNIRPVAYDQQSDYGDKSSVERITSALLGNAEEGSSNNPGNQLTPDMDERRILFNMLMGVEDASLPPSNFEEGAYRSPVTEKALIAELMQFADDKYGDDKSSWIDSAIRNMTESPGRHGDGGNSLGNFTVKEGRENGQRYIEYNDVWDLNPFSDAINKEENPNIFNAVKFLEGTGQKALGINAPKISGRIYLDKDGFPSEKNPTPTWTNQQEMNMGGKFKVKKKAKHGMRVKKANQGMVIGDPKKHQEKIRALGPNNEVMYVPAGEGAMEDPENYLNLEKLDSILDSGYSGDLPFSAFRDQVRRVEAGPDAKDPYGTIQEVNVLDERGNVIGTEPVRKELQPKYGSGAYQLDYPTAVTAYNRLKAIADKRDLDYPLLTEEDLMYPSSLPPEIQDMLFTAHFAKDEVTSVESVKSDSSTWADQWYKGHYKGSDLGRLDHFRSLQ